MNKEFEMIFEKLEELQNNLLSQTEGDVSVQVGIINGVMYSKKIVQEVAEEYNNGWIPCSERLPEKNGMYLCTQNNYDLVTNKKIIKVSTELVEFDNGKWRRAKNLVVTHWQPLPEPYKERD